MKKDIETRKDIELLVNEFYERVKNDDLIAFIFTAVRKVDWNKHLPVMYDFWENILFQSGTYYGNPMALHKQLHQQVPLKQEYFQRWVYLFDQTVDDLFYGENASLVKKRASSIAEVMQMKILHKNDFLSGKPGLTN
ncbi:MAG: group III truncated hemoglobin [Bacteroidetes bacterium]|nr:group III truncated hemoglobin [Bacteroidota bacterium]MBS1974170.1 group III truncated hemoglobin [Bacteroidota bacterium]